MLIYPTEAHLVWWSVGMITTTTGALTVHPVWTPIFCLVGLTVAICARPTIVPPGSEWLIDEALRKED